MKTALALLVCLSPGCSLLSPPPDYLKDPQNIQFLEHVAQAGAEKAALKTAAAFQVTDQSAVKDLVTQAKVAATASVQAAVNRLDAQSRADRQAWREEAKQTIANSLQGVGGAVATAGTSTGNPLLIGLGTLVALAGGLFINKKMQDKKEAPVGNAIHI